MSRAIRILTATLILVILTLPAIAFYDVVEDRGTGIAIIYIGGDIYATVWYIDLNHDGKYSEGDDRTHTVFFRKEPS